VFVDSMSDLFHEDVPDAYIDRVFAVMALAPRHTFQVLTKRPERMRDYLSRTRGSDGVICRVNAAAREIPKGQWWHGDHTSWPWPNVWLGVSAENQEQADKRIPELLQTPAAVRFISAEPLLGPLVVSDVSRRSDAVQQLGRRPLDGIDWVIVGGESGPGARPCNVAWVRSIVRQGHAFRVPVFVKQLGAQILDRNDAEFDGSCATAWPEAIEQRDAVQHNPHGFREEWQGADVRIHLRDRKGGDMAEWPEDLRVRQFPEASPCA
jgi:protein gp37